MRFFFFFKERTIEMEMRMEDRTTLKELTSHPLDTTQSLESSTCARD